MRKLVLAVAVAMASGKAVALGLGEIQLHSSLNEPFNADIQLISERPAELQNAVVRLAPQDAFKQASIEWPSVLGDLKFNVVQQGSTAVVKVTSSQPIREPFLDFIVQLQWPNGRLLREYTVLLDPPMFSGEKAVPLAAPVSSAPTTTSVPSPVPAAAASPETPAPTAKPPSTAPAAAASAPASRPAAAPQRAAGRDSYGPTQRADTAWAVANHVRPDPNVTVQQAMLALLEANPEAFYGHNVNNLLAGYVLRVPARELMTAVPAADAEREVNRQYQQWRQVRSGAPVASDTALAPTTKPGSSADATATPSNKVEQSSRLRLATPGESTATTPGAGGGQGIEKLRNDLAIALESADAARRENEELRSRLSALEGQINSMQRLMTLKDGMLAGLQKQSGGTAAPTPPPATPPAAETPPPTLSPAPAQPKPAVKPAAPAAPPAQSSDLLGNPALIVAAGGGVLLLLALAWLIARRRREGTVSEETRLEPIVAQAAAEAAAAQAARKNTVGAAVAAAEEASLSPQMGAVADEVARGVEGAGAETASELDVMHTAEGDIDPIVEADVYLAYRRYQQAETLIQSALAKQPQRLELKVKLLEIYYAARNVESFRTVAESLHNDFWQKQDDALWQRVIAMGAELLPDHILFNSGAGADKESAAPIATAGAGAALFAAGDAAVKVTDGELPPPPQEDFLGLGANETAAAPNSHEESLDLDLNLGAPQQTDVAAGGDGLDEVVHGASGTVADVKTSKDVAAVSGAMPAGGVPQFAAGKAAPASTSWQAEPALSDFGMDFNLDNADFLAGTDIVGTKLDLARAYIDMGDHDSARDILEEVLSEGNPQQKQEAQTLSQQLA